MLNSGLLRVRHSKAREALLISKMDCPKKDIITQHPRGGVEGLKEGGGRDDAGALGDHYRDTCLHERDAEVHHGLAVRVDYQRC